VRVWTPDRGEEAWVRGVGSRGVTGWGEGHATGRAVKSVGVVIALAVQSSLVASHQPLMLVPFVVILQQQQQPAEVTDTVMDTCYNCVTLQSTCIGNVGLLLKSPVRHLKLGALPNAFQ